MLVGEGKPVHGCNFVVVVVRWKASREGAWNGERQKRREELTETKKFGGYVEVGARTTAKLRGTEVAMYQRTRGNLKPDIILSSKKSVALEQGAKRTSGQRDQVKEKKELLVVTVGLDSIKRPIENGRQGLSSRFGEN